MMRRVATLELTNVLIYTLRSVGGVGDMGRLAGIPGPGPADGMGQIWGIRRRWHEGPLAVQFSASGWAYL